MAFGQYNTAPHIRQQASALSAVDEGLRTYMLRIYGYMTAGLAITGSVAWAVHTLAVVESATGTALTVIGQSLYTPPLAWIVMFAPLGIVLIMSFGMNRLSASATQGLFWLLALCYGVSLSSIFLVYTGESIVRVFFIASAMFLAMSLYGYTTKRSLAGFGPLLMMGVIGIFIASIANIFIGSSALQFAVSVIGVLVFTGLTAYDTQRLKEMYVAGQAGEAVVKQAVMGALKLYLDLLLIFVFLLQIFGSQRS